MTTTLALLAAYLCAGALTAHLTSRLSIGDWAIQLLVALDQLVNVLVTPFNSAAWADETLSSRAYRAHAAGRRWGLIWMPSIDLVFFWQRDPRHCERAYRAEAQRAQLPPESR